MKNSNAAEKIHVDELSVEDLPVPFRLVRNPATNVEVREAFMSIMKNLNPFELAKTTGMSSEACLKLAEIYLKLLQEKV